MIKDEFNAARELALYLLADRFKIRTLLGYLSTRLPGEFFGSENGLPDGAFPQLRVYPGRGAQDYFRDLVLIDGIMGTDGFVGEAVDESGGRILFFICLPAILLAACAPRQKEQIHIRAGYRVQNSPV